MKEAASKSKVQVPIQVSWEPKRVSILPAEEKEGENVRGSVEGNLVLRLGRIKLVANVSMALSEKKGIFGGKNYYIAEAEDGRLLLMISENTSVEEVHVEGEYRSVSRPGRDDELSLLIKSIIGKDNPTKPFSKKIVANAELLAERPGVTRCLVRIEDSVWIVEVHHAEVFGEYEVDIGNLRVLPKSLPVTKDLLVSIVQTLIDPKTIERG